MGRLSSSAFFVRVVAIPHGCVGVSSSWDQNVSEDSGDVEGRPLEHSFQQLGLIEVFVSPFFNFFLHRDSSGIMDGVRLVSIVVGLDQEPVVLTELVVSICGVGLSFDNHTFIVLQARNDEVNGARNFSLSEATGRFGIGR
jgi:hypothetical protein